MIDNLLNKLYNFYRVDLRALIAISSKIVPKRDVFWRHAVFGAHVVAHFPSLKVSVASHADRGSHPTNPVVFLPLAVLHAHGAEEAAHRSEFTLTCAVLPD